MRHVSVSKPGVFTGNSSITQVVLNEIFGGGSGARPKTAVFSKDVKARCACCG